MITVKRLKQLQEWAQYAVDHECSVEEVDLEGAYLEGEEVLELIQGFMEWEGLLDEARLKDIKELAAEEGNSLRVRALIGMRQGYIDIREGKRRCFTKADGQKFIDDLTSGRIKHPYLQVMNIGERKRKRALSKKGK